METDANLLLVSRAPVPDRIVQALEGRGALVETSAIEDLAMTFRVVGPDLVVHFGLAGARETFDFLRKDRDDRMIRLVLIGARPELAELRKFDRTIVLGVLAKDMPEGLICERILALAGRKTPHPSGVHLASARVPSVPPEVQDPHLQRKTVSGQSDGADSVDHRPSASVLGADVSSLVSSSPPPASEESIRVWIRSTPPPRIAEKEQMDELPDDLPRFDEELASVLPDLGPDIEGQEAQDWMSFDEDSTLAPSAEQEGQSERAIANLGVTPDQTSLAASNGETWDESLHEESHHDRDTLMMDIDPSSIESEDTIADRETALQLFAEAHADTQAESSLSSVVTDAIDDRASGPRNASGVIGSPRPRLLWGALGLGIAAVGALSIGLGIRVSERPVVTEAKGHAESLPVPQLARPADLAQVPRADEPFDPWVQEENVSIPACESLLGDKKELRLGDVDQNALLWKRARGKLVIGDREGALTELCRATYIFPTGLAVEALIEQLLDMDAPRKAEPYMLAAERARPHRPKTLELKGDLLSQLGDHAAARQTWLQALGLVDHSEKILQQIARQIVSQADAMFLGGQIGLAERLFRRAATLDPRNQAALRALSKIASGRGESQRAQAFEALAKSAQATQ